MRGKIGEALKKKLFGNFGGPKKAREGIKDYGKMGGAVITSSSKSSGKTSPSSRR